MSISKSDAKRLILSETEEPSWSMPMPSLVRLLPSEALDACLLRRALPPLSSSPLEVAILR